MRFRRSFTLLLLATIFHSLACFVVIPNRRTSQRSRIRTSRFASSQATNLDKNVYRPDKVDGIDYDAIVIGSGIGGLTAASLVAQAGKRVLVLEQHYVAGGACHTFQHKGYRFATGIHYVGEMGDGDIQTKGLEVSMKRILDTVAPADDPVLWDRMDDHYETVFIGGKRYEIVAGDEALQQALMEQFPDDEEAIMEYYALAKKVRAKSSRTGLLKSLPLPLARVLIRTGLYRFISGGYKKYASKSVDDGLQELTTNKDLQALLAYNYGDYGTDPSNAPFWMQLMLATHYLEGAYYPRGGPSQIPQKAIKSITDNGGKVLVSAPVERILVNDDTGKVKGVKMKDGNVIDSSVVISDAGFINTATKLLPPDLIDVEFSQLKPGPTGINLFVGLKGDAQSFNLPKTNVWIHPSNDLSGTAKKLDAMTLEQALESDPRELGLLFVGCPCTKDSSWANEHPGKSAMEIVSSAPFHWFEKFASTFDNKTKSHGIEYENAKTILAEKQWTRVVQVLNTEMGAKLPKTLAEVDFYEVGSPLTFMHYYNAERGAFYGLDNNLKRFEPKTFFLRLRPQVPEVPGLYLAGQDVMTDGLGAAMIGGLLCAAKVLGVTNPSSLLR